MAECQHSSVGNEDSSREKQLNEIRRKSRSIEGFLTRYILNARTITDGERLKRVAFGEKDKSKPHRTILLVGETGVGKSTLINAMVNYMLGVSSEDRIWCEINETKCQIDTQTTSITVYDVYTDHSPFSLTIINTPGFESTDGRQEDLEFAKSLHELFRSSDGVHEIDAVCLVVTSLTIRLTERQLYVFNSVLSLFGNDLEENIVVFITHAARKPNNAIKAIKESEIPCAQTDKGEPVYFRFDNFHCENFDDEEILEHYPASWTLLKKNMESFLTFLKENKPVSMKVTEAVLRNRKQLTAIISNIKEQITLTKLNQKRLEQAKEALQQGNVQEEEKEQTEWKWWYPGLLNIPFRTRTVKKNKEDLRKNYKKESGETKSLISQLKNEIAEQEGKTHILLEEYYQCVVTLHEIALQNNSILQQLDFLIEKINGNKNPELMQKLAELKKRAKAEI